MVSYTGITGKVPTKKVKITCSTQLYNEIFSLIDDSGEYTSISDYAASAAKYLLEDYFTYFLPAMWKKMASMGFKYGDQIVRTFKLKPKSKYNDKRMSFQASLPIGLINSYSDAIFCAYNIVDFPEVLRFSLEYYKEIVIHRRVRANNVLLAHLNKQEHVYPEPWKPTIEFE